MSGKRGLLVCCFWTPKRGRISKRAVAILHGDGDGHTYLRQLVQVPVARAKGRLVASCHLPLASINTDMGNRHGRLVAIS